ncbi:MAG: SGNH/GDSL hydrolase family protein [Terracoccus sp.]
MTAPAFDYSNLSDRPTGPVLRTLSALLPGVRRVQDQVTPWARAWEAHNRRVLAQEGPIWVALGDSMTQGIGASAPERGWAGQLSERLTGAGWDHRLVNLSVSGARVEDVLDRQLPALDSALAASGAGDAALVTVVIGSNDIVAARHRDGLVERFAQMLDRLPPGSVVANLPNPRREARAVDTLLRERAADGRLVLADMREEGPRSWRGRLAADLFHPNDLGYADMATVVGSALDRAGLPG